jgi:ribosomal protein L10
MAITRDKKNTLVAELTELFASAKGSAGASYTGTPVADMQELRKMAREAGNSNQSCKKPTRKLLVQASDTYKMRTPVYSLDKLYMHLAIATK